MYDETLKTIKLRIKFGLIATTIVGIIIFGFYWIFNHAYIEVTIDGSSNSNELTYEFTNQSSKKTQEKNTSATVVKKMVKRGNYDLTVKKEGSGSIAVIKSKSFLGTSRVNLQLSPEKYREFVGDNPSPCMYYGGTRLISYECGSSFSLARNHIPASSSTPAVAQTETSGSILSLEGIIKYKNKNLALLRAEASEEAEISGTKLYDLSEDLTISNQRSLNEVNPDVSQKIVAYKEGFLIYDDKYQNLFYYKDASSSPEKIIIDKPTIGDLVPQQLSIQNNRIAITFSERAAVLEPGEDGKKVEKKSTTIVQIYENGETKSIIFDTKFALAQLCGEKYFCATDDRVLSVFDIQTNKPVKNLEVSGVYNFVTQKDNELLLFRYDGVYSFNIANKTGGLQYNLGLYKPCGIELLEQGNYLLCLINPSNDRVALLIDTSKNTTGNIDQQVLNLIDKPFISSMSVSGNYIYLTSDLGTRIYDSRTDQFIFDPAIVSKTNTDIQNVIKESGIDQSKYTVITTGS